MTINEALVQLESVINIYRSKWTFAYYSWEDICQDIRSRVCQKFHTYDQTKPFKPWVLRLISNFIKNELRNRYFIYSPPCLKCKLYLGEHQCKLYGEKLNKCELYKKFQKQKGNAANVNFPVSYEQSNYDIPQTFTYSPEDFAANLNEHISGVHKDIFHYFFASGMSSKKIAKEIKISGYNLKERLEFIEISLKETEKIAEDIIEDKKISLGISITKI